MSFDVSRRLENRRTNDRVLGVVAIYVVVATLWLMLSDGLMSRIFDSHEAVASPMLLKGGLFVLVSAASLYWLLHRFARQSADAAGRAETLDGERLRALTLLESLIDLSPDVIFAKDRDGRYLLVNKTLSDLLGKPPAQIIGMTDAALHPPEVAQRLREHDENVVCSGQGSSREAVLQIDGRQIDFISTKSPLLIGGKIDGVFGVCRDVTQLKLTEARAVQGLTSAQDKAAELDAVFQALPDLYFRLDAAGTILDYRARRASDLYVAPEHFLGRSVADVLPPDVSGPVIDAIARARAQGGMGTVEYDLEIAGELRHYDARIGRLDDRDELVCVVRDMTESHRAQRALRASEEGLRLAASVFENTDQAVLITDAEGTILEVNRAFSDILGHAREAVIGANPRIWKSERHDESFYRDMWHAIKLTGQWRGEMWNRRADGSIFPVWMTISDVRDETGQLTHYVAVFSDISQIKHSQAQLDHLAHHDALTDLPNRLLLNERLEQAIRHAARHDTQLALLFLDLDHFKHINDSLGHPVGDQLLRTVAARLGETVRNDDTVARIGGDEFVLLLEDVGRPENAAVAAEKLMSIFKDTFRLDARAIRVTASLGISIYPRDGTRPDELLRNADAAMYRAKHDGRNTYHFYTEELTRNAFERVLLENSLTQALERDELRLCYQPQRDLKSGRVVGVEALIRWQHPQLGVVAPARFIPIAEDAGLIHSIGEWVLRTACAQGRAWLDQGVDMGRIAVNVAGPQIQRGGLTETVRRVLAESGFPADRLELEVTEGFIMGQADDAVAELNALRALGVTLAIDDFGTGYSSLGYLKKLPVHTLKIDQSFVRDIPGDANDMAIADAIIAMARSLKLTVVAEGVETREQAEFLQGAGCDTVQGYLYSAALPAADVAAYLAAGNAAREVVSPDDSASASV